MLQANTAVLKSALVDLDEIVKGVTDWAAEQRTGLEKLIVLADRAEQLEATRAAAEDAAGKVSAASAPETRETIAADPSTDHTLDDFHGEKVPRSSSIKIVTATHWIGRLGESEFEGAPDSVAASLRQAAADAASFLKG